MELDRIKQTLHDVAAQCVAIVRSVMDSDVGINDKVGTNTLTGSNAYKNIEAINTDDLGIIHLLIPEYAVRYIDAEGYEYARRPKLYKSNGKRNFPPQQIIAEWAERKGIAELTDNRAIYLISNSIWEFGIKARPFIEPSFDLIDEKFAEWADKLFDDLCSGLDEFFNQ